MLAIPSPLIRGLESLAPNASGSPLSHADSKVDPCSCTTGDLGSRIAHIDHRNFIINFSYVPPEVPPPPAIQKQEDGNWRWNDKILPLAALAATGGIIIGGILYGTHINKTFVINSAIALASTVAASVGATAIKATYVGCTAIQNGAQAFWKTWRNSLFSPFKPKGIIINTLLTPPLSPFAIGAAVIYLCN